MKRNKLAIWWRFVFIKTFNPSGSALDDEYSQILDYFPQYNISEKTTYVQDGYSKEKNYNGFPLILFSVVNETEIFTG